MRSEPRQTGGHLRSANVNITSPEYESPNSGDQVPKTYHVPVVVPSKSCRRCTASLRSPMPSRNGAGFLHQRSCTGAKHSASTTAQTAVVPRCEAEHHEPAWPERQASPMLRAVPNAAPARAVHFHQFQPAFDMIHQTQPIGEKKTDRHRRKCAARTSRRLFFQNAIFLGRRREVPRRRHRRRSRLESATR